jgi:hypothetical protein
MTVSRRRFLEVAACAVPGAFAGGRWPSNSSTPAARSTCALVDLGTDCALAESLKGFTRGLAAARVPFQPLPIERLSELFPSAASPLDGVVLVPGGVLRSPRVAEMLRDLADRGATVVYESGAAYADSAGFASEQRLLARYFRVRVDEPIDLWHAKHGPATTPYVQYAWPSQAIVRDFSRVIPLSSAHEHETFARVGVLPAAGRIHLGAGKFIFLGSPLGPHLGYGDREAQVLLEAFLSHRQMS